MVERVIYSELKFECFGEEIVTFLDRAITAAMREGDKNFRTLCMFFLDAIVSSLIIFVKIMACLQIGAC